MSDSVRPHDGSPSGSPVPGLLRARTLEQVAISISNAWKWKVKVKSLSRVQLLVTPWTAAYQAPPSMGFSRQEYWSGVPLPSLNLSLRSSNTEMNFTDIIMCPNLERWDCKQLACYSSFLLVQGVLFSIKYYFLFFIKLCYFSILTIQILWTQRHDPNTNISYIKYFKNTFHNTRRCRQSQIRILIKLEILYK